MSSACDKCDKMCREWVEKSIEFARENDLLPTHCLTVSILTILNSVYEAQGARVMLDLLQLILHTFINLSTTIVFKDNLNQTTN